MSHTSWRSLPTLLPWVASTESTPLNGKVVDLILFRLTEVFGAWN